MLNTPIINQPKNKLSATKQIQLKEFNERHASVKDEPIRDQEGRTCLYFNAEGCNKYFSITLAL